MKRTAPWAAAALLIVLGMSLHLPSARWGFLWDDFLHQGVLRYGEMIPEVSPLNLYDYRALPRPGETLGDLGIFPWWTSGDFRVRFFRPVTSASIFLDHLLYGDRASGYHVTNILLFGLLLTLAWLLYRNLGCGRAAATWALAFLALEDIHVLPVGWIANRNSLLANIFTVATLLGVDRHRRTGSKTALAASVLFFLLACGSKETALITAALVGLYLLFMDSPPGEETFAGSIRRVLGSRVMWLFALAAGLYVAGYALTGHGANTALYSIPWQERGAFAVRIISFLPLAAASLFFGLSTDLVYAMPHLARNLALAAFPAVVLLVVVMGKELRSSRPAGFAAGWVLVALAPAAGVPTSDRLLIDAAPGSALLLGLFVDSLLAGAGAARTHRRGRLALCLLLVFLGPLLALPMTWIRGNNFFHLAATDRSVIAGAEIEPGKGARRQVFLLNPPSSVLALTMLPTWTVLHDDPGLSFYPLQMARRPWEWRRDGARSLVVSFGPPPLLSHRYELLFRTSPDPPPVGTVFETSAFRVTVLEVSGKHIGRIRMDFHRDIDDPSHRFLFWRDEALRRISPPAIGGSASFEASVPIGGFAP